MLNDTDLTILEILTEDCRTTPAQIAVMTGAGEEEVKSAIARMERERVLLKYPAMINWDRVREAAYARLQTRFDAARREFIARLSHEGG